MDMDEAIREAYHEFDEVLCDSCDEFVDLTDADSVSEAKELWNEHVENEHAT